MKGKTIVLAIPVAGLEIYYTDFYYTDFEAEWGPSHYNRFTFWEDRYYLGLREAPGEEYKFFVLLEQGQSFPSVREALEEAGFVVTGSRDRDRETGQRRVWFYDPSLPTRGEGVFINNVWD